MKTAPAGTVLNPFLYEGTDAELERLLLTGIVVAGKVARQQQTKLFNFLASVYSYASYVTEKKEPLTWTPFSAMREIIALGGVVTIRTLLEDVKMGQYSRIVPAFTHLASDHIDLRRCSRDTLVGVPGIGFKTASFFILFTRRDAELACLDTHILAFMREKRLAPNAPRTSPQNRNQYCELEKIFVTYCKSLNRPVGEVDFEIWLARNRGDKIIVNHE